MAYKHAPLADCRVSEDVVAQLSRHIGETVTVAYRDASTRYNFTGELTRVSDGYIQVGLGTFVFDGRMGMFDDDFGGIISIWNNGSKIFRNPNMQERLIEDKVRVREGIRRLARRDEDTSESPL